jgi:hypothetical protein
VIPVSRRRAIPTALLAALAALPIWAHRVLHPTVEPCPGAASFMASPRIGGGLVTERAPWNPKREFAHVDGELEGSSEIDSVRFRVTRGLQPDVFTQTSLLRSFSSDVYREVPEEVEPLEVGDATLFVHWGVDRTDFTTRRVRAYFYVRGRHPIRSPARVGPEEAVELLLSGSMPITRFSFVAIGLRDNQDVVQAAARRWMESAWTQYDRMCDAP